MRTYIRATIQNMADSEILGMIPKDTLDRIKSTDKTPEFRVYCVGHEGQAEPTEVRFGVKMRQAMQYMKDAIVNLGNKLALGTPLFHNHGATNDTTGRETIGEVVGKTVQAVGNKLAVLAATYIYPQFRSLPLDVASFEADVEYTRSRRGNEAIDFRNVTGIALGNSKVNRPAFRGATLLGTIQAFQKGGTTMLTKEEIQEAIREGKLTVVDLFSDSEIMSAAPVKKAIDNERKHTQRIEKERDEEHEKVTVLTKQAEENGTKIKTLTERANVASVRGLFTKSAETRKFNEKQKAFIEKNLDKFKSDKEGDALSGEFDTFVTAQLKEFDDLAKMFGVKADENAAGDDKDKDKGGAPSSDNKGGASDKEALMDPEKNDFIPKDGE